VLKIDVTCPTASCVRCAKKKSASVPSEVTSVGDKRPGGESLDSMDIVPELPRLRPSCSVALGGVTGCDLYVSRPCICDLDLGDVSTLADWTRLSVELRVGPRADDKELAPATRGMRETGEPGAELLKLLLVAELLEAEAYDVGDLSPPTRCGSVSGISNLRLGLLSLWT
jgi:hypothetical protein